MKDGRRRLLVLALVGIVIASLAVAGVLVLRSDSDGQSDSGPGTAAAEALAEDNVEAENRNDCSHFEYLSDGYLERRDTSVEKCKEELEYEPAYYQFELVDVRVDGDEGEIEIETYNDIDDITLVASLVVEDGEWKVDDLEEVED